MALDFFGNRVDGTLSQIEIVSGPGAVQQKVDESIKSSRAASV